VIEETLPATATEYALVEEAKLGESEPELTVSAESVASDEAAVVIELLAAEAMLDPTEFLAVTVNL
jgi:hypothetical protein